MVSLQNVPSSLASSRFNTSRTSLKIQVCEPQCRLFGKLPASRLRSAWLRLTCLPADRHLSALHAFPVLQHHYKSLAAHALSEDDPIPVDLTEPDAPVIAERVGKCVKNIKRLLGEHPQLSNTTWNRARTASGALADEADDQPKPRVSQARPAMEIGRLEAQLVKEFGNYRETGKTSLTNDKLKDYLKQKGVPKTSAMKKAELLLAAEEQLIKDGKLSKSKNKEKKEKKKRRVSEDSDDE